MRMRSTKSAMTPSVQIGPVLGVPFVQSIAPCTPVLRPSLHGFNSPRSAVQGDSRLLEQHIMRMRSTMSAMTFPVQTCPALAVLVLHSVASSDSVSKAH